MKFKKSILHSRPATGRKLSQTVRSTEKVSLLTEYIYKELSKMSLHVNTLNYVSFAYQLYTNIVLIICSANYSDHLKNFIIMYTFATIFKFIVLTIINSERKRQNSRFLSAILGFSELTVFSITILSVFIAETGDLKNAIIVLNSFAFAISLALYVTRHKSFCENEVFPEDGVYHTVYQRV
jgi:hypothetical protein